MKTITQITQSHLSVFVFDKQNSNPVKRMPMYAEVAVIGKKIPETIAISDIHIISDLFGAAGSDQWIKNGLEKYWGASYFNNLTPAEKNSLVENLTNKILEATRGEEMPINKKKGIAEDVIKQLATEMNIPFPSPGTAYEILGAYPLGMLATDHTGYLSYNLKNVPRNPFPLYDALQYAIYLYPMGKETARVDALLQGRITPDIILAKIEIEKPVFEANLKALKLPAMQNPDLADWYMSPGSFAALPDALIGEAGCENMFPANFSTQEFRFRQIVRLKDLPPGVVNFPQNYKFGYVDEYKVSLIPIGHSLGEIKYSLPLAPGESVKLAIIDWSRTDSSIRTEDTQFAEKLLHDTHRDRSITETVQSALNEWQRGGNVQGGVNASLFGIISIGGGGGYSTSSGSRDLAASNVQKLSDSFSQASSALREFHSTVVVQSKQEEKENIQTRTFTNYNHSHTLTILYYEILRHFRMVTEWINRRPVALLPYDRFAFTDDVIIKYRYLLEPGLLNEALKTGFDAIEKLGLLKEYYLVNGLDITKDVLTPATAEADMEFIFFELGLKTGIGVNQNINPNIAESILTNVLTPGGTLNGIDGFLLLHDGTYLQFYHDTNTNNPGRFNLNYDGRLYNHNFINWQIVRVERKVMWRQIAGVVLRNFDSTDAWLCESISLNGISNAFGTRQLIENMPINALLMPKSPDSRISAGTSHSITGVKAPGLQTVLSQKLEKNLTQEEMFAAVKLRSHLAESSEFYYRVIYLNKDTNATTSWFETHNWGEPGNSTNPVTDPIINHVEPTALELFGGSIAYPLLEEGGIGSDKLKQLHDAILGEEPEQHEWAIKELASLNASDFNKNITSLIQSKAKTERLISVPTRGIFAEGKLGHCNISEEIDDTRFWKWEQHPIPVEAPEIDPVTPVTPQSIQQNVQPSPFPNSSINIVSPAAAPDPQGLAAALKVLATPSIFRDMSGRQETADLLKSLANETVSMEDAANKAKEIQQKYGADLDKQAKEYNLGLYKTNADLIDKVSKANINKLAEANAKKAEIEAAIAQAEAAKNVPAEMRKPVQQAAANALAGNPVKSKTIVFKTIGFNNQTIEGNFKLSVRDVSTGTNVINAELVGSYFDRKIDFQSAEPALEVGLIREGTQPIKILDQTIYLERISISQKADTYTVNKSHKIINIKLKQDSKEISFKAKTTDSAVTELMNKWGGELGVSKVVALKLIEDYENKKSYSHTTDEEKSYTLTVPTQIYTLEISSKA